MISIDLNGEWEFRQYPTDARRMADLQNGDWYKATVPGGIYQDLISAGVIDEAEFDAKPWEFKWVGEKDWIYRRSFEIDEELFSCERKELVFEGLDTVSTIWLNGRKIGGGENMFTEHRFDAAEFLRTGVNEVMVKFDSAWGYAKRAEEKYGKIKGPSKLHPAAAYVRKSRYQFGWDFCPSQTGCGICRGVRVEGSNAGCITDIDVRTVDCDERQAQVKVGLGVRNYAQKKLRCCVHIGGNSVSVQAELFFEDENRGQSAVFSIDDPKLWWPRGYGERALYDLRIELFDGERLIDSVKKRFGIRRIEVDRASDKGFGFIVNGRRIYVRGANWSPPVMEPGCLRRDDYQKYIEMAAGANINMLRVWGGGYYESEDFYDMCDESGILVWQDFMFACGYYPEEKHFFKEIKRETEEIVRRLRLHACIAIFCGNNEIDWMHREQKLGKAKKFWGRGIFEKILPAIVEESGSGIDYISSTPLIQGKGAKNRHLTWHEWDVWSEWQSVRDYVYRRKDIPAFLTEFGMQSLPCRETLSRFKRGGVDKIGIETDRHNYQIDGMSRVSRYTTDEFPATDDADRLIYYSQLSQGRGVKSCVENLRVNNDVNSGVMFWQFADCAPAVSWSAVDANRDAKALYYYARRFYADLLIAFSEDHCEQNPFDDPKTRNIYLNVVNDGLETIAATVICRRMDFSGKVIDTFSMPVIAASGSRSTPLKLPGQMACRKQGETEFIYAYLERDGLVVGGNYYFFLPEKYLLLKTGNIETQIEKLSDEKSALEISSDVLVRDAFIECESGQAMDNYVTILPGGKRRILISHDIKGTGAITITTAKQQFPIKS
jgi:beta-mannosidase